MRASTLSGHPWTGFLFPHPVEALLSSIMWVDLSAALLINDDRPHLLLIKHQISNVLHLTYIWLCAVDCIRAPHKKWKLKGKAGLGVEPAVRIELTTDGLQNRCSTAELSWRPRK